MPQAYLDYAATAPLRPEVRRAMQPFLGESFGNPSSVHRLGVTARQALEDARQSISQFIGAAPEDVIFTSGGTESINLALQGAALHYAQGGLLARCAEGHIITSSVEHPATLETARALARRGWDITFLPVDSYGMVDPDEVRRAITPRTALVSLLHANNEVGTIQPIEDVSKLTRERGVLLHVDAVQSAGKIPVDVEQLGVDLLSISAHKLGGPKGVGALYTRTGTPLHPLIYGGGQERGLRSGTENVAGAVGFATAAGVAAREMAAQRPRLTELTNRLVDGVMYSTSGVHVNGHPTQRLPGFAHFCFEGLDGHWLVKELSRAGICAATGSACASGKSEPSHVLTSMGIPIELAKGALRLTLGWATTVEDVRLAITVIPQAVERLRARAAAGADLAEEYARDCYTARDRAVAGFIGQAFSRLRGLPNRGAGGD